MGQAGDFLFMESKRQRKQYRLNCYDYSQSGAYFITICTFEKICLFGNVINSKMILNNIGEIAQNEWHHSSKIRSEIRLNEFIIMPNHIHGIIIIDSVGATGGRPKTPYSSGPHKRSLGSFVAGYKSSVTKHINFIRRTSNRYIWQRNFYDHIIRDNNDLKRTRQYIIDNPIQWKFDRNHPDNQY